MFPFTLACFTATLQRAARALPGHMPLSPPRPPRRALASLVPVKEPTLLAVQSQVCTSPPLPGSPCRPLPARDPLGGHMTRGRRACSGSPWLGPAPAFEGRGSVEGCRPPCTVSPARPGLRSGLGGGGRARGRVRRSRDCGASSPRSPAFPTCREDGGASGHAERAVRGDAPPAGGGRGSRASRPGSFRTDSSMSLAPIDQALYSH